MALPQMKALDRGGKHDGVGRGAEGGEVRRLEMGDEGGLVVVDLVEHHLLRPAPAIRVRPLGISPPGISPVGIDEHVESAAARLMGERGSGVAPDMVEELALPAGRDAEPRQDHEAVHRPPLLCRRLDVLRVMP